MNLSTFATSMGFEPHSVTGMIKCTWFTEHMVKVDTGEFGDETRRAGTSIYLLLSGEEKMTWHKLKSDEVLFFHHGVPLKIHLILPDGKYQSKLLGNTLTNEEADFQVVIPHGSWFAYELTDKLQYAFYSEVVAPGFEFKDWSAPPEGGLVPLFPQHKDIIEALATTNRASSDFMNSVLVRPEKFDTEMMELIASKLQLAPHPVCRGGFFSEVWRTEHSVTVTNGSHEGKRQAGSSIYMVLKAGNNGLAWHIHKSDELLIYHGGGAIKFHFLDEDGNYSNKILGDTLSHSEANYQVLVHHGTWYAFELMDTSEAVFFGAVLAPAFVMGDWSTSEEKGVDLLQKYPQHGDIVRKMATANWMKN
ncbi:uncharacterized protein LOC106173557 [Lingula anatina]|uniref:Uncharacterized protein LOC106173557 n=1 Tax=Lingula anatina TaxID=7574 RepID=A0A1S3JII2_LINAN|nr:uncharacterized protein LOC106173557 [Lingula anatina]|eukprot:XP_013410178.1 uncharacterized protein LOC106173557 [Lingula anatina]